MRPLYPHEGLFGEANEKWRREAGKVAPPQRKEKKGICHK
jgi:hypothetical protein